LTYREFRQLVQIRIFSKQQCALVQLMFILEDSELLLVWLELIRNTIVGACEASRFDFESNFRFGIRFIVMIRFKIFESSAPSIVLCKETIGGG